MTSSKDGLGLFCLMTPAVVSVRTFGVMYDHTFLKLQLTRSDHVSLVIAHGHLIFLQGLCGYMRDNILTLSPPRWVLRMSRKDCGTTSFLARYLLYYAQSSDIYIYIYI